MEDSALLSVGKDGERRRFAWWERTVYAVPRCVVKNLGDGKPFAVVVVMWVPTTGS